jgi:hypothetical protein
MTRKRDIKQHVATVVALDASPTTVLRSMRGLIVDARIAYPDVLHVEVRDSSGCLWRLATQDAEWSPADPAQLIWREFCQVAGGIAPLRRGFSFGRESGAPGSVSALPV